MGLTGHFRASNYPPGVTGNEPEINPDDSGDETWEDIHNQIEDDASNNDMSDMDVSIAWKLGLAAWKAAAKYGAKFPHSDTKEQHEEDFYRHV